jgi:uncharacterized damage-inducible protein DinB
MIQQLIQQVVNAWTTQNKNVTDFFTKYPDEAYLKEVATGRNRAVYLLGHLIASNDGILPLFGIGEKLFPQYEDIFSKNPDKTVADIPSVVKLKADWEKLNTTLTDHFNKMTPADWFSKHTAVSEEDFAKDPLRNKLNVLIGRTNHQSYHRGQLNLLTVI